MGHLFAQVHQRLFPDDLSDHLPLILIRPQIVGIVFRPLGEMFVNLLHQYVNAFAGFRADGQNHIKPGIGKG
ncbi:hypothetical protein SDC9_183588 [bioreactor metagenome]|uniref:Uncharacterized protein n=1 Tax=bioreactor metagenome TaxID=1076179 RepID=A0A645HKC2_9ZZZZ